MSKTKFRITTKQTKGSDRQINLFAEQVSGKIARRTHKAVKVFLDLATTYTPKYSGEATESWAVQVGMSGTHKLSGSFGTLPLEVQAPEYEYGIYDAGAPALNKRVTRERYNEVKSTISSFLKRNKKIKLSFFNTSPQSELWLDESGDTKGILRSVNEDYYTYRDLDSVFKARMKSEEVY